MPPAAARSRGDRYTLRIEAGGALLYDRSAHQYLSPTAAEAFLLVASQELSFQEARTALSAAVGKDEAASAVRVLRQDGLLRPDGSFRGRVVRLPAVPGGYGAPLVAHLGTTQACNFACAHCYSSSGKRAPDELSIDEMQALIDQLHELGCMKLVLGGGEPLLREDLPRLIRYADHKGLDTFVHTNGSLLKPEVLRELAACPPAGLSVSLDGPDQETNDRVRGPNAWRRALRGLETLRAHYPPGFNISFTVTPANAELSARMAELARDLGARTLLLRPAYPAGEALKSPGLTCDRDTFARAIDLARPRAAELGLELDAPHPYEAGVPDFEGFGCVAARIVLGIDPSGNVTPCLNLPGSFASGNVRERRLADLWRGGRTFLSVRAQTPNPQCQRCRHYDTCRGGCRVRALFAGNGLSGPDAWCHFEPLPQPSLSNQESAHAQGP